MYGTGDYLTVLSHGLLPTADFAAVLSHGLLYSGDQPEPSKPPCLCLVGVDSRQVILIGTDCRAVNLIGTDSRPTSLFGRYPECC